MTMKFTYEDCKRLDEKFGTDQRSPLHRANRFPEEYKRELRQRVTARRHIFRI